MGQMEVKMGQNGGKMEQILAKWRSVGGNGYKWSNMRVKWSTMVKNGARWR